MSLIVPTRRGFIAGLVALVAAPAIIRVADLMPVKALPIQAPPPRPRPWHNVDIIRGDQVLEVAVDGMPIAPAEMVVGDYGWNIKIPEFRLIVPMPPQGSHQRHFMREAHCSYWDRMNGSRQRG